MSLIDVMRRQQGAQMEREGGRLRPPCVRYRGGTMNASIEPWTGAPWTPRSWQRDAFPRVWATIRSGQNGLVYAATGAGKSVFLSEVVWRVLQTLHEGYVVVVTTSRQRLVRDLSATIGKRLGEPVGQFYGRKKTIARCIVACIDSLPKLIERLGEEDLKTALWIADEAHSVSSDARLEQVKALAPVRRLAVTATPFDSKGHGLVGDWVLCFEYRIGQAIRDGALVRPVPLAWTGEGEPDVNVGIGEMILQHAPEGPGIVSAHDITDAEWYASVLTDNGIPALAIHSRLKTKEQDSRIERLKNGELRCLVHPSILAEGVDFPWLTWGALRTRRSKVRLVQEVGRFLRCFPGKTEAIILDPLRQLAHLGIDHEAMLERLEAQAAAEAGTGEPEEAETEKAVELCRRISDLSQWCEIARDVVTASWGGRPRQLGPQRDQPVTQAQRRELSKRNGQTRWIPAGARSAVKELLKNPDELTRGAADDLLAVLQAGAAQARDYALERVGQPNHVKWGWKWPAGVALPDVPGGAS